MDNRRLRSPWSYPSSDVSGKVGAKELTNIWSSNLSGMTKYKCSACGKSFARYSSQVRNPATVCCSKQCQGELYKTSLKGANNPNYRHGGHVDPRCECGAEKDYRSLQCANCSNIGFPVGKKNDIHTKEEIETAITGSTSFLEAATRLNTSRLTVTKYAKKYNVGITHFRPGRGRFMDPAEVLKQGSKADRATAKKTVLRLGLLEEKCACGITNTWQNAPIVLEMDHIDGDRTNHSIENLRFVCPNCHSQSPHHKGSNRRRYD